MIVGALDIGGTHVTAGRVDLAARAVEPESRIRVSLRSSTTRAELLDAIVGAAATLGDVSRLGVAIPGPFDYVNGVSRITHKLKGLHGVDLRAELARALGLGNPRAIRFLNDAQAFVLGEWWAGAARGRARVVGITLGTGLGSAFMANGRVVDGPAGLPLYRLSFRNAPVEDAISSRGLLASYGEDVEVAEVAGRAAAGEAAARRAFAQVGRALAEFLAPWLEAFEADCVVVVGSIARAWRLIDPGLAIATVAEHLDDAPLLGAALFAQRRPVHELSVAEAREIEAALAPASSEPVAEVLELTLAGLAARAYLPDTGRNPVLLFLTGGGWALGSLETADAICRRLANRASCAVVSVDFRRAPEHPVPAGLEDCYAAARSLSQHAHAHWIDERRLAVGGTSAGGNLAAAVALLARERRGPALAFQLLVYPPLDQAASTPSRREPAADPLFGPEDVAWCWRQYLADPADGDDPLASPLRAADLRGLPPALVITAGLDPLRDEAALYAERLRGAGVPGELVTFEAEAHGFFSASDEAQSLAATAVRRAFEATI